LRFAFIQRGSVFFWMHVRPKNEKPFIAGDGSKIICRERQEPPSPSLCGSASVWCVGIMSGQASATLAYQQPM
jgi:hypothetical protein